MKNIMCSLHMSLLLMSIYYTYKSSVERLNNSTSTTLQSPSILLQTKFISGTDITLHRVVGARLTVF